MWISPVTTYMEVVLLCVNPNTHVAKDTHSIKPAIYHTLHVSGVSTSVVIEANYCETFM